MGVIGGGSAWRRTSRTAFSGQPCDETVAHEFERLTIQLHLCPRSSNAQFTLYGFHCTHTVYIRSCIVYVGCTTAETAAVFEMLGRAEPMALPVTMFSLVGGIEHEQPPSLSSCAGSRLIGLESHTFDKEDDARLPKKCEDAGAAVDVIIALWDYPFDASCIPSFVCACSSLILVALFIGRASTVR